MSANRDVIKWSAENAVTSLENFLVGINGIPDVYRINWILNFEAMPMKLSEEINNFSAENINVQQKYA